jgi:hypothetical protein
MAASHVPSSVGERYDMNQIGVRVERGTRTLEGQNGDFTVGGGAREDSAQFVWSPGDGVD